MSGKRHLDEFKEGAVQQVVERGCSVAVVADRLGLATRSSHTWVRREGQPNLSKREQNELGPEDRWLKAAFRRVAEERDILTSRRVVRQEWSMDSSRMP